jgi:isopenicillin N synthase-like dioxygenase
VGVVCRDLKAEPVALIPVVDIGPLFAGETSARQLADRALFAAARDIGFLCVNGLPPTVPLGPAARERLLAIFALAETEKRRLYRRKFAPENPNVYRGWFPVQPGNLTSKEGIDLGSDVLHPPQPGAGTDPLLEPTPLPDEKRLPGWRAAIAAYYASMESTAAVLMRSLARSLALPDDYFDSSFHHGLSTLRLIRYPPRAAAELAAMGEPDLWVASGAERRHLAGAPHTDSGFVTLLAQGSVAGLQARCADGRWIDVPPAEGTLVVNFGQVLERWSAARIRATEHRVVGSATERYCIPFFYEARADATIAPLPLDPADAFTAFQYGDFLWQRMLSFVEFRGMESLRVAKPGHARNGT